MHKRIIRSIFILIILIFAASTTGEGQRRSGFNLTEGMTITPRGGYNLFFGDLVDKSRGSYSGGVLVDRELTRFLSARSQLIGGVMQGTQVQSDMVYAEFDNFYTEFTVGGAYHPLNHLLGYFRERTFQPYAHLNTGLVYYNATEYWGKASDGPTGEEWRSASGVSPVISLGGGADIWINPVITANIEISGSLPFTDQMDVHDVWYNSYEDWQNNVNPHSTEPYDFYYNITVGISITLNNSEYNNHSKYNRRSYLKTQKFYRSKSRRSPSNKRDKKGFLFFW
ncbi:MAG: hypothetical protein ACQEQ0_14730 [Bacteroidota bacterium]